MNGIAAALLALALACVAHGAQAQGGRYVSMGSSYAAGPGVGVPDKASGGCGRSMSNYARTVAQRHGFDLVDVACSGATTDNILEQGQHGFPAQVEAVTRDTRLVSVLIGGNDIEYVGNLFGLSCRAAGKAACKITGEADVERRLAALPEKLDRVVAEVRRRAPAARIVLVGYLPAEPAGGATCAALAMTDADARRMRDTSARLARVFEDTARRNGIDLVRAAALAAGHDACSADAYVTGRQPAQVPGWPEPVAYHPTQAGMDRVAAAFDAILER
ncbi:SGNH/GDSL hydrolase family protein [uncultured Massilia sp.]|uniref:SGNH/GDSL hydrolase family protein n=1 Tax=uncultured Massilia sp. TaxID=169973 RepID=UPI0025E71703|nr:SGNH/GDSL hydrolase family protein [uncultured Massilia sp.]